MSESTSGLLFFSERGETAPFHLLARDFIELPLLGAAQKDGVIHDYIEFENTEITS